MTSIDQLKASAQSEIDRRGDELIAVAKTILANPEPGFRETKTSRLEAQKFGQMGIPYQGRIAITGLKGVLNGGSSGPTVAVMGELDSLKVIGHPHADPDTNAAHACGHHCQIGMMLGVAAGLMAPGVLEELSGRIALMAVPAEEYIEIEYRDDLRRQGRVEFLGGKPEFIRTGALDDVDIAMMTHTSSDPDEGRIAFGGSSNGMVAKRVQFTGRAAHAGGAPHAGVNALNAAMIALSAIHAQRETHRDWDRIRIHPIITRGGASVNSVPADVRMETYVRGRTIEAYREASDKVDRALRAGAMAVGGSVTVTTLPGFLPLRSDAKMLDPLRGQRGAACRAELPDQAGPPHRLHGHGRRIQPDAGDPPLRRGRLGHLPRRRLPGGRLRAGRPHRGEGDGHDRGRPAVPRGRQGQRGHIKSQTPHDQRPVPIADARDAPGEYLYGVGSPAPGSSTAGSPKGLHLCTPPTT